MQELIAPTFTPHQRQALAWLALPAAQSRSLYWAGSVRSAKTYGAAILSLVAATRSPGLRLLHGASSEDSYDRNILPYLYELGQRYQVHVQRRSRPPRVEIGQSTAYIYGGGSEGAHRTLQGFSSQGTFLDEVTLMPESFVVEAIARTTAPEAKLIFTMNPESPNHWFKRKYWDLADESGALRITSRLTDNPYIPASVADFLASTLTGHYYQRKILGEWAGAEGLVYPIWRETPDGVHAWANLAELGVDYGQAAPTAAVAVCHTTEGGYSVEGEYYSDTADVDTTIAEHAAGIQALAKRFNGNLIIADPSAAALRAELRKNGMRVMLGRNDVDIGIQNLAQRLESGAITVNAEQCPNLALELRSLEWDAKATDRGEDRPNPRQADHALDALRYWAMWRMPPVSASAPIAKPEGL